VKSLAIAAVFLVSTIAAQTVRADDDPYARKGGYIGVGGTYGVGLFDGSIEDAVEPLSAQVSNSWGAHATAGYRFNKYLAAEAEYEWVKGFRTRTANVPLAEIQTQTATANLKVIAPYRQFEPYFLVGAGATFATVDKAMFNNLDITTGGFSMRFGAGLDYYLSPNFLLNVGTDVVVNSSKISSGIPGNHGGHGLDYLAAQIGFGWRF